jgi:hypothetical protein
MLGTCAYYTVQRAWFAKQSWCGVGHSTGPGGRRPGTEGVVYGIET